MLYFARAFCVACVCCLAGCDLVLGLNDYQTGDAGEASTAREEPDSGARPQTFTIGMISALEDRVAQRQHGASMAVDVINQAGGVPDGTGRKRTLTLSTATGPSAANALRELQGRAELSAVIGPDSSDDMLELLTAATVNAQLFTIGPNNTVDSIVEAQDSWSLVPTDHQRMPLLMRALAELEAELKGARGERPLRLSVVYRDDAFGRGWRAAIERASWGGVGLLHADNQTLVSIEPYDPKAQAQAELVERIVAFAPDVVINIGMSELVTQIMGPLEYAWQTEQRPEYLLTDAAKGAELLELITERTALMPRVHGVGATAIAAAEPSHQQFLSEYAQRFSNGAAEPVGVEAATAYDAVFVIAYALAASTPGIEPGSGPVLAQSLRRLTGGELQVATHEPQLAAAFSALSRGQAVSARGTLGAFEWDSGGGIASGAAELWCVVDAASPRYASTGLTFDIAARSFGTRPSECDPSAPAQTTTPTVSAPTTPGAMPVAAREADAGVAAPDAAQDAAPIEPPYSLTVQYQANDAVANDSSIRPFLRVINAPDGEYVALRELSLRYYIDNEHADRCPDSCVAEVSYAGTQPSGRSLRAQSRFVATSGTLGYLEVTFNSAGQGDLAASESLEVQLHFHTMPYLPFDESNDYSFDPTALRYRTTERITAHVSDMLVWGNEPPR